jgi:hypothetical protein
VDVDFVKTIPVIVSGAFALAMIHRAMVKSSDDHDVARVAANNGAPVGSLCSPISTGEVTATGADRSVHHRTTTAVQQSL